MTLPANLSRLLATGRVLRPAGDQIWSAMAEGVASQRYDGRAAAYDRVVGSRLYNRLLWGSSPAAYASFAARAVHSQRGPMLDAGCGSLVFTAGIYAETNRPLVLLDRSLGMLEAARDRLKAARGVLPDDTVFIQGDLFDLPFTPGCFSTVLSMGMLHLFDDPGRLLAALGRAVAPGGTCFSPASLPRGESAAPICPRSIGPEKSRRREATDKSSRLSTERNTRALTAPSRGAWRS